jgi:hypothetical protein
MFTVAENVNGYEVPFALMHCGLQATDGAGFGSTERLIAAGAGDGVEGVPDELKPQALAHIMRASSPSRVIGAPCR